jgi:hypothetical protein
MEQISGRIMKCLLAAYYNKIHLFVRKSIYTRKFATCVCVIKEFRFASNSRRNCNGFGGAILETESPIFMDT